MLSPGSLGTAKHSIRWSLVYFLHILRLLLNRVETAHTLLSVPAAPFLSPSLNLSVLTCHMPIQEAYAHTNAPKEGMV